MIEIKLTAEQFEELYKKGYTLDMLFLLKMLQNGVDYTFKHPKIFTLDETCRRKGLISDKGTLTVEGQDIINCIYAFRSLTPSKEKKEAKLEGFDKWWKAFPGTDTFEYKGKKFKGTRALRVKKDDCKAKINKIINEGECTIEDMIGALKLEIHQKMENSYKTATNKMSYFQNSLTYLNQRTFEPYLELLRAGHKAEEVDIKPTFSGGVEI